jgi:hypothetical protein
MEVNQEGGAAGSAFGKGCVYVMTYTKEIIHHSYGTEEIINYYKIGCTSRDPNLRLQEIQRSEGNPDIILVGSVKANEMNGAETAAQKAAIEIGLVKDPARGGATDWFIFTSQRVLDVVRQAVSNHN